MELAKELEPGTLEQYGPGQSFQAFSGTEAFIIAGLGPDCVDAASQIATILQIANWKPITVASTFKSIPAGITFEEISLFLKRKHGSET